MQNRAIRCPLCNRQKARRKCPALGKSICSLCCGTKRLTEIQCPPTCTYLISAREHPAAVVKRQQQNDVAILIPTLQGFTERQHQLFFLIQSVILRHKPDALTPLLDNDVAEAAAATAATLETSIKGIIYEHTAQSAAAQRLTREIASFLEETGKDAGAAFQQEVATVLRSIERGARDTSQTTGGGECAYLELMGRLLQHTLAAEEELPKTDNSQEKEKPRLIMP